MYIYFFFNGDVHMFSCVCLQYHTITTYFHLPSCTFLTHLYISCSSVTFVLKLSAWCEWEERAREMRGKKRAMTVTPRHRIFPSQALPPQCVRWLVLTLTAHCNIPSFSSHCQAISSGCLLFCLRLSYMCASRPRLDLFTHGLISTLSQE